MSVSVSQILHQGALRHPDRVACVVFDGAATQRSRFTYATLDASAKTVAAALMAHGVEPGQNVALCVGNSADFIAGYFGVLYLGATVVPLPVVSAPLEVEQRIKHAACAAIVFDSPRAQLIGASRTAGTQALAVETLVAGHAAIERPCENSALDTAMLLYTSGTTGQTRAAAISHGALLSHTSVLAYHALQLTERDRILGVLPLAHSYGCRMVMLAAFYAGATCTLLPRFDAEIAMRVMADEQITWLPGVPTMFSAIGALTEPAVQPRLRWAMCAGAPLADETARRAESRLGCEIRQGFGMTEATIATLNSPPDNRVLGSVGKPVWGVEVRIVSTDGQDTGPGQQGEVWIRGHNTMSHYLDDPVASAQAKQDGFIRTGDLGMLDGQGRLFIVDRLKDLIIRGGNNVYPSEVENVLVQHPAITAAAVVGRADDHYGEEVVAVVECKAGVQLAVADVVRWARERVSKTKVPREVVFVRAFPLGPSGKVLKRELRRQIENGELKPERPVPG